MSGLDQLLYAKGLNWKVVVPPDSYMIEANFECEVLGRMLKTYVPLNLSDRANLHAGSFLIKHLWCPCVTPDTTMDWALKVHEVKIGLLTPEMEESLNEV